MQTSYTCQMNEYALRTRFNSAGFYKCLPELFFQLDIELNLPTGHRILKSSWTKLMCEISGSHGGEFEHDCLLGCCAV
jgi:hypothetical protein